MKKKLNKKIYHAIILARGGSKEIKNKNIVKINNKPLIYWSIKECLKSKNIKETWVSSDSEKILTIAKKFGAKIIKRPKRYSADTTSSEKSWLHAITYLKKRKIIFDYVVGVQPTSPIRSYIDFDNAINLTNKNKFDSLFTSLKIKDYFVWKENKKKLEANYNYKKRPRRQVIISKYLENGSFYIFNTKKFLKEKCRLFGKIGTYSQNKIKSFQIDDKEDLKIINKLI